ncbi:MAG: hypothetical protein R2838_07590 [Caldilineaceae bacterium]
MPRLNYRVVCPAGRYHEIINTTGPSSAAAASTTRAASSEELPWQNCASPPLNLPRWASSCLPQGLRASCPG